MNSLVKGVLGLAIVGLMSQSGMASGEYLNSTFERLNERYKSLDKEFVDLNSTFESLKETIENLDNVCEGVRKGEKERADTIARIEADARSIVSQKVAERLDKVKYAESECKKLMTDIIEGLRPIASRLIASLDSLEQQDRDSQNTDAANVFDELLNGQSASWVEKTGVRGPDLATFVGGLVYWFSPSDENGLDTERECSIDRAWNKDRQCNQTKRKIIDSEEAIYKQERARLMKEAGFDLEDDGK